MKTKFNISESEKKEILNLHNVIKESLHSKLKKNRINEQESGELTGVDLLTAAKSNPDCKLAYGGKLFYPPSTTKNAQPILRKTADYDSQYGFFKKGDELIIKGDYTFEVLGIKDGQKVIMSTHKWSCPALVSSKTNVERIKQEGGWQERKDIKDTDENLANPKMYEKKVVSGVTLYRKVASSGIAGALTDDQKKVIEKWKGQGYKLVNELDPEEKKTWVSFVVSPASEGVFSQDLIMYAAPSNVTGTNITTVFQQAIQQQELDKDGCKKAIEAYFNGYKTKMRFEPNVFEPMKQRVQACKNSFYPNNWGGIFSGQKRINEMLEILSGMKNGKNVMAPSQSGENAKWRLK